MIGSNTRRAGGGEQGCGGQTIGVEGGEKFCLNRPQLIEKSRFEKINVSKRKQIYFRLFSLSCV
jgi:hypothetical protein